MLSIKPLFILCAALLTVTPAASAYVALSRMKQHVQVYTDNRQGWTDAINNAVTPRRDHSDRAQKLSHG